MSTINEDDNYLSMSDVVVDMDVYGHPNRVYMSYKPSVYADIYREPLRSYIEPFRIPYLSRCGLLAINIEDNYLDADLCYDCDEEEVNEKYSYSNDKYTEDGTHYDYRYFPDCPESLCLRLEECFRLYL